MYQSTISLYLLTDIKFDIYHLICLIAFLVFILQRGSSSFVKLLLSSFTGHFFLPTPGLQERNAPMKKPEDRHKVFISLTFIICYLLTGCCSILSYVRGWKYLLDQMQKMDQNREYTPSSVHFSQRDKDLYSSIFNILCYTCTSR